MSPRKRRSRLSLLPLSPRAALPHPFIITIQQRASTLLTVQYTPAYYSKLAVVHNGNATTFTSKSAISHTNPRTDRVNARRRQEKGVSTRWVYILSLSQCCLYNARGAAFHGWWQTTSATESGKEIEQMLSSPIRPLAVLQTRKGARVPRTFCLQAHPARQEV